MTTNRQPRQQALSAAESASIVLAGYRLLRFKDPRWSAALSGLARPLLRLHRLRHTQERAWQVAIRRLDCPGAGTDHRDLGVCR
jgi:hypothetical protein